MKTPNPRLASTPSGKNIAKKNRWLLVSLSRSGRIQFTPIGHCPRASHVAVACPIRQMSRQGKSRRSLSPPPNSSKQIVGVQVVDFGRPPTTDTLQLVDRRPTQRRSEPRELVGFSKDVPGAP